MNARIALRIVVYLVLISILFASMRHRQVESFNVKKLKKSLKKFTKLKKLISKGLKTAKKAGKDMKRALKTSSKLVKQLPILVKQVSGNNFDQQKDKIFKSKEFKSIMKKVKAFNKIPLSMYAMGVAAAPPGYSTVIGTIMANLIKVQSKTKLHECKIKRQYYKWKVSKKLKLRGITPDILKECANPKEDAKRARAEKKALQEKQSNTMKKWKDKIYDSVYREVSEQKRHEKQSHDRLIPALITIVIVFVCILFYMLYLKLSRQGKNSAYDINPSLD